MSAEGENGRAGTDRDRSHSINREAFETLYIDLFQ